MRRALSAILAAITVALALTSRSASARVAASRGEDAARAVIAATFGTGGTGACAQAIAWRESRDRPTAANWSDHHSDGSRGSFGLFQIGALWRARDESVAHFAARMFDPVANTRKARELELRYGWAPWGGC